MGAALPDKLRYAFTPSGGYKEGTLYSLVPNDNVGNFDVSRTGVATRVNKDGLIEVVDANVPRLDYSDGGCPKLLTEVQSENLIPYSEDFSQWTFSGDSLTSNYAISIDGTQNATRVVFSSSDELLRATTTLPMNVTCTASIYIKGNKGDTIQISAGGVDDLKTLSGEWERIETTQTSTSPDMLIDTYGGATARDILVWGGQLEQLPYPTSYIPNFGNSAGQTRGADSLTNFGSEQIIDSESGILFFEGSVPTDEDSVWVALTNDSNSTTTLSIGFEIGGAIRTYSRNNLGVIYTDAFTPLQTINSTYKFYLKYNETNVEFGVIGYYSNQSNSFPIYGSNSFTQLTLSRTSSLPFYGRIRQVKHLPYNTDITTL